MMFGAHRGERLLELFTVEQIGGDGFDSQLVSFAFSWEFENRDTAIAAALGSSRIAGALGHPREGRAHLAGSAEDEDVSGKRLHHLDESRRRFAEEVFELV